MTTLPSLLKLRKLWASDSTELETNSSVMTIPTGSSTADHIDLAQKESAFFAASKFAVVGASNTSSKWGAKIFKYLVADKKDVVPININETVVDGQKCLKTLSELPDPKHTAVCVVVPAKATIQVLHEAQALGIPYMWFQPGTTDNDCLEYIRTSGLESRCIFSKHPATNKSATASVVVEDVDVESNGTDISGPCNGIEGAFENPSVIGDHVADLPTTTASNVVATVLPEKRKRLSQSNDDEALKAIKLSSTSVPSRRPTLEASALLEKQHAFVASPKFAVVGASNNMDKFGAKVFKFLKDHDMDVVPVNLNETTIQGVTAFKGLLDLPDPTHTAISVDVPPQETLKVLRAAKALKIPFIWLQPGTQDAMVLQFIRDNDLEDHCIYSSHVPTGADAKVDGPISDISGPCPLGASILDAAIDETASKVQDLPCLLSFMKSIPKAAPVAV